MRIDKTFGWSDSRVFHAISSLGNGSGDVQWIVQQYFSFASKLGLPEAIDKDIRTATIPIRLPFSREFDDWSTTTSKFIRITFRGDRFNFQPRNWLEFGERTDLVLVYNGRHFFSLFNLILDTSTFLTSNFDFLKQLDPLLLFLWRYPSFWSN